MKRNFRISIFVIFAVLLNNEIGYSQTNFWEPINFPSVGLSLFDPIIIADNGDIWIIAGEGIVLSTDNGDTWTKKEFIVNFTYEDSAYSYKAGIYALGISPVTGYIFACTGFGVHKSTDKGESWTNAMDNSGYFMKGEGCAVTKIFITPSGEIYAGVFTHEGGISYSNDDGNTWITKNNGLPQPYQSSNQYPIITSFALGIDNTIYTGTDAGVYRSTDEGNNWLLSVYYNQRVGDLAVSNDGSIFGAVGGTVIKSTDKGFTWNSTNGKGLSGSIDCIVYNPITGHLFVGGMRNSLYRSTDLGENWYKVWNGLPSTSTENQWFRNVAVNPITGTLFVGIQGEINTIPNVYRSTPDINGVISVDVVPESINFDTVQFGFYKDTDVYITNSSTIDIVITDIDITGNDASSFLNTFSDAVTIKPNETQKFSITFKPNRLGQIADTIVMTSNIGNIWISLNGNCIPQLISIDEPENIPTTYSLSQNYPNPFNPTTIIQYAIPKDEFVKLTVYDITGKVVKELVSGHKAAGRYSVEFNASSYSSGTYYYKLEAGGYNDIQKMMLIK